MVQKAVRFQFSELSKQANETVGKMQKGFDQQLSWMQEKGIQFLREMGAEAKDGDSVAECVNQLRANNRNLREFLLNLDKATYVPRKQLVWNTTMMSSYAKMQAAKQYDLKVKPAFNSYSRQVESRLKSLKARAEEAKSRLIH